METGGCQSRTWREAWLSTSNGNGPQAPVIGRLLLDQPAAVHQRLRGEMSLVAQRAPMHQRRRDAALHLQQFGAAVLRSAGRTAQSYEEWDRLEHE